MEFSSFTIEIRDIDEDGNPPYSIQMIFTSSDGTEYFIQGEREYDCQLDASANARRLVKEVSRIMGFGDVQPLNGPREIAEA